ncbi:unnamed protein product [Parnassius apollo]|nr:unnamed protein product [Parnassius apollo]
MLKHSDTEDDVDNYTQRRRSHNKSLNLNPIAQDMMGNVVLTNRNTDIASSSADLPIELNYNLVYTEDIQANSTNTSQVFSNDTTPLVQDSVSFDISKMFENQKQILDNQATILSQIYQNRQQQLDNNSAIIAQIQSLKNVQNSFIQKVSALSVQMEDAVFQITSSYNQDVQTLNSSKGHVENIPIYEKPVDSAQELDELENQLSDPNNRDCLKNRYSILCSGGKAIDCAYMLVDVMFTRKFICECSWSGGSRGEDLKIPLKGYKHVLSFFWNMVHYWDQEYSLKDNELFFKTILKNAKKRKIAKLERASTSRQRSKPKNNLKRMKFSEENETNVTSDNGESENEINEEENTINKKKRNDSVEEHTKENKEGDVIKNISKDIAKYNSNVIIGKETSV